MVRHGLVRYGMVRYLVYELYYPCRDGRFPRHGCRHEVALRHLSRQHRDNAQNAENTRNVRASARDTANIGLRASTHHNEVYAIGVVCVGLSGKEKRKKRSLRGCGPSRSWSENDTKYARSTRYILEEQRSITTAVEKEKEPTS